MLTSPEILTDCGGGECPGCGAGTRCNDGADCESAVCGSDGRCAAATCTDDALNGNESDADCGGNDLECARCPRGDKCRMDPDCASNICSGGTCVDCEDSLRNGNEPGVDCGGMVCQQRCSENEGCAIDGKTSPLPRLTQLDA